MTRTFRAFFGFLLLASSGWSAPAAKTETAVAWRHLPAEVVQGSLAELDSPDVKLVVVMFWASWCSCSREALPHFETVQRKFASQGVRVIAVNVDESKANMRESLKEQPLALPVIRDSRRKILEAFGVKIFPAVYAVDRGDTVLGSLPSKSIAGLDNIRGFIDEQLVKVR